MKEKYFAIARLVLTFIFFCQKVASYAHAHQCFYVIPLMHLLQALSVSLDFTTFYKRICFWDFFHGGFEVFLYQLVIAF